MYSLKVLLLVCYVPGAHICNDCEIGKVACSKQLAYTIQHQKLLLVHKHLKLHASQIRQKSRHSTHTHTFTKRTAHRQTAISNYKYTIEAHKTKQNIK